MLVKEYLLQQKDAHEKVDLRNDLGSTSLHLAAVHGKEEIAKYLLEKGF